MIGEPSVREVSEFLAADGYVVAVEGSGARLLARDGTGRKRDDLRVWLPTLAPGGELPAQALMAEMAQARAAEPATANLILLQTLPALGTDFLRAATEAHALVRTFGFFFDSPYRQGGAAGPVGSGAGAARKAADLFRSEDLFRPELLIGSDAVHALRASPGAGEWRVAQPFVIQTSVDAPHGGAHAGADLLPQLIADAAAPAAGASMTLVVGPAGIGKSILFSAFFTYLYSAFQQAKLQQRESARPIAILPSHLAGLPAMRTGDLFDALTTTVGARPMSQELLDWSLKTGRALLLCDGIDEFFAEQTDFFAEIDRRHLSGGQARYYVFLRDSLLGTSPSLAKLVSDLTARGVATRIYRMLKWQQAAGRVDDAADPRRTMVWLRREGRRPGPGEADTAATADILREMRASPVLWELAGLPLFCELIITELSQGGGTKTVDEYDLLELLLDRLASREWDKLAPFDATGRGAQEEAFIWSRRVGELMNWTQAGDWSLSLGGRRPKAAPSGDDMAGALAAIRRRYGTRGLYEILEEIAFDYRCPAGKAASGKAAGGKAVPPARGFGLGSLIAKYRQKTGGMDKLIESQGQRILTQFALFTQGNERTVDFAHPIVADFLAARYVLRSLRATPGDACRLLDHAEPDDAPVFFGYLRREVVRDAKLHKSLRAVAASARLPADCKSRIARVTGE
jgi:hypothetical protein